MKKDIEVIAPSNIAILKYWGKVNGQHPLNPSISFTLKNSLTTINASYSKREDKEIVLQNFIFNGQAHDEFKDKLARKIKKVFQNIKYPFGVDLELHSENTFPHSSGIASSASSMAAVTKIFAKIFSIDNVNEQSSIAREFSGSASRSITDGWSLWGKTAADTNANQDFAIDITSRIHPEFQSLQDWIFICSDRTKAVSSTEGHQRMEQHPFKEIRLQNVQKRVLKFLELLEVAPTKVFFDLLESEALELHALMMTSTPPVLLFEAQSIALMKKITELRADGIECGYTLDAGSSVHLLFPKYQLNQMKELFNRQYFGIKGSDFIDVIFDECSLC